MKASGIPALIGERVATRVTNDVRESTSAELDAVMTFCPQLVGQHHLSVPSRHQQISPGIIAKLIRTLDRLPEGWLKLKATATAAAPWAVEVTANRWQQSCDAGLPSVGSAPLWAFARQFAVARCRGHAATGRNG